MRWLRTNSMSGKSSQLYVKCSICSSIFKGQKALKIHSTIKHSRRIGTGRVDPKIFTPSPMIVSSTPGYEDTLDPILETTEYEDYNDADYGEQVPPLSEDLLEISLMPPYISEDTDVENNDVSLSEVSMQRNRKFTLLDKLVIDISRICVEFNLPNSVLQSLLESFKKPYWNVMSSLPKTHVTFGRSLKISYQITKLVNRVTRRSLNQE